MYHFVFERSLLLDRRGEQMSVWRKLDISENGKNHAQMDIPVEKASVVELRPQELSSRGGS